jgi:predicted  nucleic acid-binding Zn-ribbon protein
MTEELSVLVQLQRKDIELKELLDRRKSIPAAIKIEEDRLREEEGRLRSKGEEFKEVSRRKRNREMDLEELGLKIEKLEGRLLKVANNKEYQALLVEINNMKALQSNGESELLKLMEQEEEVSEALSSLQKGFEPRAGEVNRVKEEKTRELERNEELIPGLRKDREEIAKRLSPAMRTRYERIAKVKNGLAVVPVMKGACGGCFTGLPAQRINEIRLSDQLITCENCGRIIVWDEQPVGEGGKG